MYSWDDDENKYTQRGSDINGEAAGDYSGWTVSLSDHGNVLAVERSGMLAMVIFLDMFVFTPGMK